ncbi:MAG: DUF4286 family protein [Gammaproteobacteria bacterium]
MGQEPVTYEVALAADPEIQQEFGLWLEGHVADMLALPGFESATIHRAVDPATDRLEQVVRYRLSSRDALEDYLRDHAPRMRAEGLERFGARFSASRRIIEEGHRADETPPRPCANCGVPLHGQYCSACGQRARVRMITFWELVRDAGDLLASLDSRLWRTLRLLLFRPGRLTVDYLQGKRARYVAPLRLFIASSLIFFFVATVNTNFEITVDGEGETPAGTEASPDTGAAPDGATSQPEEAPGAGLEARLMEQLTEAGVEEEQARRAVAEAERALRASGQDAGVQDIATAAEASLTCERLELKRLEESGLGDYITEERARDVCRKIVADHGASFGRALLSNLPTMMFVFLPLMAVVMKLLYPLSGRYYAEHLLFLVHYHAFFYILATLLTLAWWSTDLSFVGELPARLFTAVVSVYLPVYLFRAMRRVYGQSFAVTMTKYLLLGAAYFSALTATFLVLLAYTALTL